MLPDTDRDEPGVARADAGECLSHERRRVSQKGMLEQNPPASSMPPPANQGGTDSMPRGYPALTLRGFLMGSRHENTS